MKRNSKSEILLKLSVSIFHMELITLDGSLYDTYYGLLQYYEVMQR